VSLLIFYIYVVGLGCFGWPRLNCCCCCCDVRGLCPSTILEAHPGPRPKGSTKVGLPAICLVDVGSVLTDGSGVRCWYMALYFALFFSLIEVNMNL
jgi:hypothetical protein